MTPAALDGLVTLFGRYWGEAERRWAAQEQVVLPTPCTRCTQPSRRHCGVADSSSEAGQSASGI